MSDAGQHGFSVLTVCTGNICRSPAAERLIRARWAEGDSRVRVESGGTGAMVGEPIFISMAHLLEQSGAYSGEFAAQDLVPELVERADLVLGMTRRHRAATARLSPSATAHTFTLNEFARLVSTNADGFEPSGDRVRDLHALVQLAMRARGPVAEPELDDIADPYGRDLEAYQTAFAQIRGAVDTVAGLLRGASTGEAAGASSAPTEDTAGPTRPAADSRAARRARDRRG